MTSTTDQIDEVGPEHPAPVARDWWDRIRPLHAGLGAFVVMVTVSLLHSTQILTTVFLEDGDFAVNSILIDRAKDFQLLIGNYSRVGFNHPGPGFMYVQAWAELLFHDWLPVTRSPHGAHQLGAILLNSSIVAIAAGLLASYRRGIVASIVLVAAAIGYASHVPSMLTMPWMPNLYVWPYLLLLIAGGSVLAGRHEHIWAVVLAGGFLVHGHASFIAMVPIIAAAPLAAVVWRRRRSGSWDITRRTALWSAGIAGIFLLPIVVNLILNWPGEFVKYVEYSDSEEAGHKSLLDIVRFLKYFWVMGRVRSIAVLAGVVLVAVAAWRIRRTEVGRLVVGLLVTVAAASVAMFLYSAKGVDSFGYTYLGRFYHAAPMTLIVCAALLLATLVRARWAVPAMSVVALLAVGFYARNSRLSNDYPNLPWLADARDAIEDRTTGPVALQFGLEVWAEAAGLTEQLRRHDVDLCILDSDFLPVLFTPQLICSGTEADDRPRVLIVPAADPRASDGPIFSNDRIAVLPVHGVSPTP